MELNKLQKRFERSLDSADTELTSFLTGLTSSSLQIAEIHQLEGWLSDVWQVWCRFCRTTVFASCTGCTTIASGVVVGVHANRDSISYIAAKQKNGNAPAKAGTNHLMRSEPTWGHINKLIDVITALAPTNSTSLLSGFGTVPQIDDVRIIRNASAHRNIQTYQEVLNLSAGYRAAPIRHPVEALLWDDPLTGRKLIQARMDDMRIASKNVCA